MYFIYVLIRKRICLNHSDMSNNECVLVCFFFSDFVVFKIHYLFIWRLKVFRLCANCNCSRMEYSLGNFFFEWTPHSPCHVRNAFRFCNSLFIYHCRYNHHATMINIWSWHFNVFYLLSFYDIVLRLFLNRIVRGKTKFN